MGVIGAIFGVHVMGGSTSKPKPLVLLKAGGNAIDSKFRSGSIKSNSQVEEAALSDLVKCVNQAIDDATKTEQYRKLRSNWSRRKAVEHKINAAIKSWNGKSGNIYKAVYRAAGTRITHIPASDYNPEEYEEYPAILKIFKRV